MIRPARLLRGASLATASPRDAWLLVRMLTWRTVLPLLTRRVSLAKLTRLMWLEHGGGERTDRTAHTADCVKRFYQGGRDPEQGVCLERSLLAYRYLSAAGADPQLVIGFSAPGEAIVGHAWVVVDSRPLYESAASLSEYRSFCSFGRAGALDRSVADHERSFEPVTG